MTERPGPLGRLDRLYAGATIAHERIAELHRRAPSERSAALMRESADIVLRRLPALTIDVKAAGRAWAEQELLAPDEATETLRHAESLLAGIENEFGELRRRQDAIVRELRGLS